MAIEIRNMSDIPWTDSGKSGVLSQNLRYDTSAGRYFGAARFEPYSRSGVHRHLGPAVSYMLEGSLSDHDNDVREGQAYINLTGAVHDVICYRSALAVARVDGAILYPNDEGIFYRLGDAAAAAESVDDTLGQPTNLYVTVADLTEHSATLDGVSVRHIYDYSGDAWDARFVQLTLAPGAVLPTHSVAGLVDWFVVAGEVTINNQRAGSGSYVMVEPDSAMSVVSRYGCRLLAWSDGPARWQHAPPHDLYGFGLESVQ
jgi:quercetin dioxygenase-like cupin family protein